MNKFAETALHLIEMAQNGTADETSTPPGTCAVCGKYHGPDFGTGDFCDVCDWEDDFLIENGWSYANHMSLVVAIQEWELYGKIVSKPQPGFE